MAGQWTGAILATLRDLRMTKPIQEMVGDAILETLQSGEEWFARGVIRRLCDTGLTKEQARIEFASFVESRLQRNRLEDPSLKG